MIENNPRKMSKSSSLFPQPFALNMEIMETAPNFIALVLIGYGIFLTGFTGGAVAGGGIVLYALSKKARGLPVLVVVFLAGVPGLVAATDAELGGGADIFIAISVHKDIALRVIRDTGRLSIRPTVMFIVMIFRAVIIGEASANSFSP